MNDDAPNEHALATSWDANVDAWTSVVRSGAIPSRRAGTDEAIVQACLRGASNRVLDVGCGEGWLARELARHGASVLGVDGSRGLIAHAEAAGGGPRYEVLSYAALAGMPELAVGPWDLIVCNFSLLGEEIGPLLAALTRRLAPDHGRLVVQTVHPWSVAAASPPYIDAWRVENFAGMASPFRAPMPWYFRTMASWIDLFREAGLVVTRLTEPQSAEGGLPLSLLVECRAG